MTALLAIILLAAFVYDAEWLLDLHFEKRVIVRCSREPYLLRWYIFKSKYITLFAHKFVLSDEDFSLHDHPWNFFVIPVWRGYTEHSDRPNRTYDNLPERNKRMWRHLGFSSRIPIRARVLPFLGARFRGTSYRHRVELLTDSSGKTLPAWSLFFHFEKVRDWGFWGPDGFFIQWNHWWQEKCE